MSIAEQPTSQFLQDLAAHSPTPGGGAAAALSAAQSAALVSMVARYTDAGAAESTLPEAESLRMRALALADEDAAAFDAVAAAYGLPRDDRPARKAAIAQALEGAARPPAAIIAVAARLVALVAALAPVANRNLITDVAAAADLAAAAASIGRLNVLINLRGISDESVRSALLSSISAAEDATARAAAVSARISAELTA
jgi:formiminotetrahydrofolate cyclodeaminase